MRFLSSWAAGLERIMMVRDNLQITTSSPDTNAPLVFVVSVRPKGGDGTSQTCVKAFSLCNQLRNYGIRAEYRYEGNASRQLSEANRQGATHAVIVGDEELERGCVIAKDMRTQNQQVLSLDNLVSYFT